ncbi:ribosomal protein S18-alanine N-acetyltransferase [Paracoccus aerodenitrificans]|uniref:ribosomal protein S18-alanine N-acetyltransferase n=1 Tax=Paracoccus aerodenitrificans TaxID=3017781 RepID=UPI0022F092A2|nr:ribosomal protein S18-alanine N-acetyltransferase [Paracoccus aerodenitrificans]WBU64231.1 ribosomal protein S18-alanine N-acetyltransferase [Paracoccus aerodenitrificans]
MTLAERLAAIHAESFTRPAPWSADSFAKMLDEPSSFLIEHRHGFAMGRLVLDEVELMTIAVRPSERGRHIGTELLKSFEAEARKKAARTGFLEVAFDNIAALTLYRNAGWTEAGRRRDYYGSGVDAIIMQRSFSSEADRGAAPDPGIFGLE